MDKKNKIHIFQSGAELADAAAKFIVAAAKDAVNARGQFLISLSGGHTPEHLYALLAKPPFINEIPWKETFIFWGDERCVPSNNKDNNANMARTLLLNDVPVPFTNIYPIPVDLPPAEAATEYEKTIKNFFGSMPACFDLILLGLGENGHTASLFPGTDVVFEKTRLIKEVYVPEQKMFRITMTAPLINLARNILFLLEGTGKAGILKTVLTTPAVPNQYPVQLIDPAHGNLYWFADKDAAAFIPAEQE